MKKLFIALTALALTLTSMAQVNQVSQTVTSYTAGSLAIQTASYANIVTHLTITGSLDARDFVYIRSSLPQLQVLDLMGVTIESYNGSDGTCPSWNYCNLYPENELPNYAFNNPSGGTQLWNLNTIKLPVSLISIGSYAFQSCNLNSITIPNGVISIGDYAFSYCQNIAGTILIPSSISSLGYGVFQSCNKITKFVVQDSNQNYSSVDSVLYNKNQTTIILCPEGKTGTYTMPNTVTTVGDYAFYNCSKLSGSINIPKSVSSIGSNSFYGCSGITDFVVSSDNPVYSSIGGVIFNKNLTKIVLYPAGKIGGYTIPNSITEIGNNAFSNCQGLTGNLIIPNTVTVIGDNAFQSCSGLNGSLTIGNGISSIGGGAFSNCKNIKTINCLRTTPPTTVSWAFSDVNCTVYTPSNDAVAAYKAATGWTNFTSILAPGIDLSITNISGLNYEPDATLSDYKYFTISGGFLSNDVTIISTANFEISTISGTSFSPQTSIKLTQIGGMVAFDTIYVRLKTGLSANTYTGNVAISSMGITNQNIALTGIVRPVPDLLYISNAGTLSNSLSQSEKILIKKLKIIGSIDKRDIDCLREELKALTDLDLSEANIKLYTLKTKWSEISYNANELPESSFSSSNLSAIQLPNTLNAIGGSAFYNCKGFSYINIPSGVNSIGGSAFNNCTSGLKINCLATTPPTGTLASIGIANAIVYVQPGTLASFNTAWGTSIDVMIIENDVDVIVNVTEAGKLATTIYNQTAFHPSLVTKLTVTGVLGATDITYIRDNMKKCYSVNLLGTNLIDLPADAFNGRTFLFEIVLPSGLKTIGNNAFYSCINLKTIDYPSTLKNIGNYSFYNCRSLKYINAPVSLNSVGGGAFGGCSNLTDVVFNGDVTINVDNSNNWGSNTFNTCQRLKNLTFKGSVTIVGTYSNAWSSGAFLYCDNLTNLIINGPSSIGNNAFKYCRGLTNIQLDKASLVGDYAFYGCNSLKTISINGAASIGNSAFIGCTALTTATINGATAIGSSAFSGCTTLNNTKIYGATSIGSNTFDGCSSLTTLDIPSSVTSIGDAAFQNCSQMDSVSIGAKVASIGASAFSGCNKLSKITAYRLTPAALGLNVFSGVNTQTCVLRILESADFDAYFSAAQWGSFLHVQKIDVTDKMGDSNEDGTINITDVINVINYILEKQVTKFSMLYSDMNKDGGINVIDVVQIVKVITGGPKGAPRLKAKGMQQAGCTWDMVGNTFVAQADGGIRGFDVAYTGTYTALPALDDFSLVPYTKNGVKRLLGYTTGNAICLQPTSLFTLSDGGAFSDMTFVLDDGNNAPLVKGITTATDAAEMQPTFSIENGTISLNNSTAIQSIELYSLSGNLMARSLTNQLALPSSTKGVYLLRINTAGQKLSYKVVL